MDIRDIGRKIRVRTVEAGEKIVTFGKSTIRWAMDNPEKAAAVSGAAAALAGGIAKVVQTTNRTITAKQLEMEKRTRIYDRSLNAYIYTKKPLTGEQIDFVNKERRRTGKKTSEILYEMGLLRK